MVRAGGKGSATMTKLIACLETLTVYVVVASALVGTVLSALIQFYPIY